MHKSKTNNPFHHGVIAHNLPKSGFQPSRVPKSRVPRQTITYNFAVKYRTIGKDGKDVKAGPFLINTFCGAIDDIRIINEVLDFNPTAENLAKWIVDTVPNCYRADVWESRDNKASYIKDDAPQIFD